MLSETMKVYIEGYNIGVGIRDLVWQLSPYIKQGAKVLARDMSPIAEFFNSVTVWGLHRYSDNEYFELFVREQIKKNDILIDTGYAGSIPRKVNSYVPIKSILMSCTAFDRPNYIKGLSGNEHRALHKAVDDFENSIDNYGLWEKNEHSTWSVIEKRKNYQAYKLGLFAGFMGLENHAIKTLVGKTVYSSKFLDNYVYPSDELVIERIKFDSMNRTLVQVSHNGYYLERVDKYQTLTQWFNLFEFDENPPNDKLTKYAQHDNLQSVYKDINLSLENA